jgi:hypothetical protein
MACLVIQNLTYGNDSNAVARRKQACEDGAIEAILDVMKKHSQVEEIYNACVASLRLTVDLLPDQRAKAVSLGAQAEWVKPVTKEGGGGLLSFRGGFGTSRRRANKNKVQENS